MSSFNTVTKIKYTDNSSDPVSLNEYIVFQDDKSKRKYLVFRFNNNVTQQLLGMQFEVCQYNVDNDLIEKSVVVYDKFLAGAEEEFVPKAKLRVSFDCTAISVRLIQAAFDRFVWKEGEFEDNTYKFGMFYNDETHPGEEDAVEKPKKEKKVKKQKAEKYKKSKRPFVMRDATTKNLTKVPLIFNIIIVLTVIAFVLVTMFMFKKDTKKFTEGDYLLRIVSNENVAVYGYLGSESNLIIPEKIGSYSVTKIDGGAFNNSDITSVTFRCALTVDTGAFVNCKKLTVVHSDFKVTLLPGAFRGCPVQAKIFPDGSFIAENAFLD